MYRETALMVVQSWWRSDIELTEETEYAAIGHCHTLNVKQAVIGDFERQIRKGYIKEEKETRSRLQSAIKEDICSLDLVIQSSPLLQQRSWECTACDTVWLSTAQPTCYNCFRSMHIPKLLLCAKGVCEPDSGYITVDVAHVDEKLITRICSRPQCFYLRRTRTICVEGSYIEMDELIEELKSNFGVPICETNDTLVARYKGKVKHILNDKDLIDAVKTLCEQSDLLPGEQIVLDEAKWGMAACVGIIAGADRRDLLKHVLRIRFNEIKLEMYDDYLMKAAAEDVCDDY